MPPPPRRRTPWPTWSSPSGARAGRWMHLVEALGVVACGCSGVVGLDKGPRFLEFRRFSPFRRRLQASSNPSGRVSLLLALCHRVLLFGTASFIFWLRPEWILASAAALGCSGEPARPRRRAPVSGNSHRRSAVSRQFAWWASCPGWRAVARDPLAFG